MCWVWKYYNYCYTVWWCLLKLPHINIISIRVLWSYLPFSNVVWTTPTLETLSIDGADNSYIIIVILPLSYYTTFCHYTAYIYCHYILSYIYSDIYFVILHFCHLFIIVLFYHLFCHIYTVTIFCILYYILVMVTKYIYSFVACVCNLLKKNHFIL